MIRLVVAFAVVSVGCQDPEYGGEKQELKFRFGLGGCTSVPATKGKLARGGTTDLVVADAKNKRTSLTVESGSPGVLTSTKGVLDLQCSGEGCKETTGTLPLLAVSSGTGQIIFTDSNGSQVDVLAITVGEATSLIVEDEDGKSSTSITMSKGKQLQAKLKGPDGDVFAKTPFDWSVEGDAVKPISSKDSVVNVEGNAVGSSIVNVRFGDLAGSIEVKVSN
ncbi:MAG: hypothetical protein ACO1OB_21410 [Archangium sp.]